MRLQIAYDRLVAAMDHWLKYPREEVYAAAARSRWKEFDALHKEQGGDKRRSATMRLVP